MSVPSTEKLVPSLDDLGRPVTDRERRRWLLRPAVGTPFDDTDTLFPSFEQTGVYDRGQEDARDLKQMLRRDGRVRQLENVLTLPVRSAVPEVRERRGTGAKGRLAADLVRDALQDDLQRLVAQGSAAMIFRKAFFEIEWDTTSGQVVPADIAWRPPATCQARFDPHTGKPAGFRQQVVDPSGRLIIDASDEQPGWKVVRQPRALIFTHGTHREPVTGTSELDAAYWCWEQRQKTLYLLFRFLERQALPKLTAYGETATQAQQNADFLADTMAAGVIPQIRQPGSTDSTVGVIESSGRGADQFLQAVRYLEEQQVQSVLAGFLQLTDTDKSGGSYALGQDARQFFLESRQADADEQARQLMSELARPIVAYNLGDPKLCPDIVIGPLSQTETGRALTLLEKLITAPSVNAPWPYVDELIVATSKFIGMDPDKVEEFVAAHAKQRAEREKQMTDVAAGGPVGAGGEAKKAVGEPTDAVFELVRRAELGQDPHDALAAVTAP